MANRARKAAMAIPIAVAAVLSAPSVCSAQDGTPRNRENADQAHVRPTTPALASLIARATEGSATFRQIVRTIENSDAYVYVMEGDCGHGVRACFSGVTMAGTRRLMRVVVALDAAAPDQNLMATIGHELRHTIEAIEDPSVRSNDALFFLYERIGFRGTAHARETMAAMDAGEAIRAEIRSFERSGRAR